MEIKRLDAIKAMEQLFEDMDEITEDDIVVFQDYLEVFKRWTHDDHEGRLNQTYGRLLKFRATLNEALKSLPDSRLYEVLKKTYLVGAPFYFEDYMIYIEWEREPQDRFYIPRQKQLKSVVKGIQDLVDGDLNELFISLPPRVGKALANDTPILTPDGWKKHGDLKVGDTVFCPDGTTATIINVNPKCQMTHRVTMTDGSTFDCHANHEWRVYDRHQLKERVLETHEMIGKLETGGESNTRGHRYCYQLLQKDFLIGEEKELPVPPYTFGAWLGDGSNQQPRISGDANDYQIIERIKNDGYEVNNRVVHKQTGVVGTDFYALRKDLQKLGFCHSGRRVEKYIPETYLTASVNQRLELLAGLLDTDGCLVRKEKRYQFTTSEEGLKNSIISLISTFGWRINISERQPRTSSSGIVGKHVYWVVAFNPTTEIPCVLERKQLKEFSKQRRIAIKSIEPLDEYVEGNCISLDREDGMYLAGERLIPTHNTSLLMFLMTWLMGRNSEQSNLYCAFSDTITRAFYSGVLEVINDPTTYLWGDVFPDAKIVSTNAQEETIDIGRKKRYHSLTARSLYGTLNGACDCNGFLISDDLIGGIEEALNKDRLASAWAKVDNNLIPRAKESAKFIWCGTRWSVADPTGNRLDSLKNDLRFKNRKYRVINVPALAKSGRSNFNYKYGVGFSTEYYQQRKASFEHMGDLASWEAQYMGQPVERSGRLFEAMELNMYNGDLPDEELLVRKFMAVDPAFGGGDYTSAPIAYQYQDGSIYIVDVVYSNANKRITQPMIAKKIVEHELKAVQFEANKMTASFKEKVEELVHEMGYRCNMTTKAASTHMAKELRIFDKAPEIRDFYYLEGQKRTSEYQQFMDNVFAFSINGKNRHDDAPDSLAMLVDMMYAAQSNVKVKSRFF